MYKTVAVYDAKTFSFSQHNFDCLTHISKVVAMARLSQNCNPALNPKTDQIMNTDDKPNIVGDANPKLSKSVYYHMVTILGLVMNHNTKTDVNL
jgi:hypothetical protein